MEKLDGKSMDLEKQSIEKIKELFPEVLTEGRVDFDKLRLMLGDEVDDSIEKYQFTWNGKTDAIKLSQKASNATLRPAKEESKNWDTTENLYIEGDNLEVLKQLQKTYFGKINMIYIDPPYNTGNDFIYKDNFKNNVMNYKILTKQTNKSNINTNGRFHTDWLNMIYPRLILAKNLLKKDGVIFVSIDENELYNLKKVLDEVFGETNFITQLDIKVRHETRILKGDKDIQEICEYCLMYKKSNEYNQNKIEKKDTSLEKYLYEITELNNPFETKTFSGKKVEVFRREDYKVIKHNIPNENYLQWISIRGSIKEGNSSGRFFMKHLDHIKGHHGYLYKVNGIGSDKLDFRYFMRPPTENHLNGIYFQGIPTNKKEFKYIPFPNFFDFVNEFNRVGSEGDIIFRNGKKPIIFLRKLMEIAGINKLQDGLILDFFSGSASTAHAVMELNSEDNGNRNFIMVQLPEKIEENTQQYQDGFHNICEIGKERIRRAGEQINEDLKKEGKDPSKLEVGFKVFKLDDTNIKEWDSSQEVSENTLFDQQEVFKEGRTSEDVLYEILLKYGVFDMPVSEILVNDKVAYDIGQGDMIVALYDEITSEDVKAIAEKKPRLVIFKDSGFANDNVKLNALHNLEKQGVQDVKTI